jgi:hypothetical protein
MMTSETKARQKANKMLAAMPNYFPFIPNAELDSILTGAGFQAMEAAIYCGREGRVTEQVGPKTWITMTWHKMEVTGRYEIVAYVS